VTLLCTVKLSGILLYEVASHAQGLVDLTLRCFLCEVALHARRLGEITLQCLLCSSSTWRGFISQLCEASFAHSNSCRDYTAMLALFIFYLARLLFAHLKSWRAYFARLALLGEPLYFNSANFVRLLCTLEVSWILLCSVYFVTLLCTLEDLTRFLGSACFVHYEAGLHIPPYLAYYTLLFVQ
jgi:hypothetical protein